jgi:hypothetical protein
VNAGNGAVCLVANNLYAKGVDEVIARYLWQNGSTYLFVGTTQAASRISLT